MEIKLLEPQGQKRAFGQDSRTWVMGSEVIPTPTKPKQTSEIFVGRHLQIKIVSRTHRRYDRVALRANYHLNWRQCPSPVPQCVKEA